jgi:hypothetical protein
MQINLHRKRGDYPQQQAWPAGAHRILDDASRPRRITVTKLNVGNLDRLLRLLLGLFLIGFAATGVIGSWGYVGIVLVLTAVVAYCPLYSVFGFRTTSR